MTSILFEKDEQNRYHYLLIKDHTNFANRNQDIVCSAISSIIFGGLNALKELKFEGKININKRKPEITIKFSNYDLEKDKFQIVIETIKYQLLTIYNEYPNYLEIKEIQVKEEEKGE